MASEQDRAYRSAVWLPLSAAQREIWMAHQLGKSGRRYVIGEYHEIQGAIDEKAFADSWHQLAREADILRVSRIEHEDASCRQVIEPEPGVSQLQFVDFSGAEKPVAAARDWINEDFARPFDLDHGGLSRFALIKVEPEVYLYYKCLHHLIFDGMGSSLLDMRLADLYQSALDGEPWGASPFGSLAELIEEDTAYRASEAAAEDRAYWASKLSDVPEPPLLGEGRSQDTAGEGAPFVRRTVLLSAGEADRLRNSARQLHTSWTLMFIALASAYVQRISGQRDLILGLAVAGRVTPLARRTPGMASNVLPLRLAVRPDHTIAGVVRAAVAEVKQALKHQRTRYEDMCRDLAFGETRRRIAAPQLNIMAFAPGLSFGGHPTVAHNLGNGPVEDLAIVAYDLGPDVGLRFDFDAAPDVCDVEAIASHQDRFLHFVRAVLDHVDEPLVAMDLLGHDERQAVLGSWSGVRSPAEIVSLAETFERQVTVRGSAAAVVCGDEVLSYAELNARAVGLTWSIRRPQVHTR